MSEPRIDRRRLRTRAALLRAGLDLFAARSVDAVSVDDIVAAADVAKGSFYNHFSDKEALAHAVGIEVRKGVEAAAAGVNTGVADPAERVARALSLFARMAGENPQGVRAMQRLFDAASVPDAPMDAGVRADVQMGLAIGRFRDLSVGSAVLLTLGVVQIGVSRVLQGDQDAPPATVARDLAFGLLRGLGVADAEAAMIAARAAADICGPIPASHP